MNIYFIYIFFHKNDSLNSLNYIITEFEMSKKHHFLNALIISRKTRY